MRSDLRASTTAYHASTDGSSSNREERQEGAVPGESDGLESGFAFGREHPLALRFGLGCVVGKRHLGFNALGLAVHLGDRLNLDGIDLTALVTNDAGNEEVYTAKTKGQPSGDKARDEAHAGAGADGDPGWALTAHVEKHSQPGGGGHPEDAEPAQRRELGCEHSGRDGKGQDCANPGSPIDGACVANGFGPTI